MKASDIMPREGQRGRYREGEVAREAARRVEKVSRHFDEEARREGNALRLVNAVDAMKSVPSSSCVPEMKGIWANFPASSSLEGTSMRNASSIAGA